MPSLPPSTRARRLARLGLAAGLVVGASSVARPASAAPTGTYKGFAGASLVGIPQLDLTALSLANVALNPATASVASDSSLSGGSQSAARGANLDATLLSGALSLSGILSELSQTAPPDHPVPTSKTLLPVNLAPVAVGGVSTATVQTRTTAAEDCLPDAQPISTGHTTVADLTVLPGSLGLQLGNANGGTVSTDGTVRLSGYPATRRAVQSVATTQLTSVTLLAGTTNEININVASTPRLTATATGTAGTSTVQYTHPVLSVTTAGSTTPILLGENIRTTLPIPLGALGTITLSIAPLVSSISADGTVVSGSTSLLTVAVELLGVLTTTVQVAPLSASAVAPRGGVVCPDDSDPLRDTQKDVSASLIFPGAEATYLISVPNRGAAELTTVKVVDTVTAPAGTTITGTDPSASSVAGLTATWNDIGPIQPNEIKTLRITIRAPSDLVAGASFSNRVDVTATYRGMPVTGSGTVIGPVGVTPPPATVPCDLSASNVSTSHEKVKAGETYQYYLHALNIGGQPCDPTIATLTIDPNEEFVACTGSCTFNPATRTITWNLGRIDPGMSKTVSAVVRVKDATPIGTILKGRGTVAAEGRTTRLVGPDTLVTGESVLRPAAPAGGAVSIGGGLLSATGRNTATLLLPALGLAVLALGLRRRLRRPAL